MRCLFFFTLRYNYLFQPYPTILFGRPHDREHLPQGGMRFWR